MGRGKKAFAKSTRHSERSPIHVKTGSDVAYLQDYYLLLLLRIIIYYVITLQDNDWICFDTRAVMGYGLIHNPLWNSKNSVTCIKKQQFYSIYYFLAVCRYCFIYRWIKIYLEKAYRGAVFQLTKRSFTFISPFSYSEKFSFCFISF